MKIPCRISDEASPRVLFSAFGDVSTSVGQGVFDDRKDAVELNDGTRIASYFKSRLGFPHFKPQDKSVFRHPPTGWISWMYYGRDVTPEEVLVNARWISENLREYGLEFVVLDDGWQADGRNWEGLRETFPQGMKWLADEIRKLGLVPGIWICPHGQDNEAFIRKTGGFARINTFGGPFTVDPTDPRGLAYVRGLIRRLTREWGYGYLKFDGISDKSGYGVLAGYKENRKLLGDKSVSPEDAYRRFFGAIRDEAGRKTFIDACSVGVCPEMIGLCDGMRTGADTDAEWSGFIRAATATMNGYFAHGIAVYSDPDCCLLRPPLSTDMARAWATLYGLTGQMLMFDDRMPDLGPERVSILKKISPAADIRPFDLFPSQRLKTVFDLKVNHMGRHYDIVAVFNYDESVQSVESVDFKSVGLDPSRRFHAYDFWNRDYLGVYDAGLFLEVPPAACRVVTLCEEGSFPVLISSSRHILQGWPDLDKFRCDPRRMEISGRSRVIKGEKYSLTFGMPNDGRGTFAIDRVEVGGRRICPSSEGRGVGVVSWTPSKSAPVSWKVKFKRIPAPSPIPIHSYPYMIGVRDIDPWSVEISWVSFGSPAGFYVKQDGRLIGYTFGTRFRVGGLEYGSRHEFEVGVADLDGRKGGRTGKVSVVAGQALPDEISLSDLDWASASSGYLAARRDRSVGGAGLSTGGRRFLKGIGTHPSSSIKYTLKGIFRRLSGLVGIEDQNGIPSTKPHEDSGQACFSIVGDGRVLVPPLRMIHGRKARPVSVDVSGVNILELLVERPEDVSVNLAPHSNWLDMRLSLKKLADNVKE